MTLIRLICTGILVVMLLGCESVAVYTSANQRDRAGGQETGAGASPATTDGSREAGAGASPATTVGCQEAGDERVVATQRPVPVTAQPQQPTGRNRSNRGGDAEYMVVSWYGNQFHGRQTASGETFNMYEYTAAHRTLPFGTRLRLLNDENNKEAIVRINDRGPVPLERDLDVSFRAAQTLDFVDVGIIRLRVEIIE